MFSLRCVLWLYRQVKGAKEGFGLLTTLVSFPAVHYCHACHLVA